MRARGVDWEIMKQKYRDVGIDRCVSFPIDDRSQDEYIDGLYNCAQHLNDLLNEQNHIVYIHDNSSISRAPALILTYLCLFCKLRTMDNLKEAERVLKQYHHMSNPNSTVIRALLLKHKAFVDKQKHLMGDCDSSGEEDNNQKEEEGVYLQFRKQYNQKKLPDVLMEQEQQHLFERQEPLIAFNGNPTDPLDIAISEVLQRCEVTIPVIRIKGKRYFVGSSNETLLIGKDGQVEI